MNEERIDSIERELPVFCRLADPYADEQSFHDISPLIEGKTEPFVQYAKLRGGTWVMLSENKQVKEALKSAGEKVET